MSLELLSSKIVVIEEAPSIRTLTPAPTAVLFAQGITQKGPVRSPVLSTSFEDWSNVFGGYISGAELPLQVRQFFLNGGTQIWTSRVVHHTDITNPSSKTSALATGTFNTPALGETQGEVISGNAGPYLLDDGQSLTVRGSNDGVPWGPTAVGFTAVAGYAETDEGIGAGGVEPFALVDGDTLQIAVDGGLTQTVTFNTGEFAAIGAATAEEVAAVINGELVGASATVVGAGTKVRVTSDSKGTGSQINVVGGTAAGALKLDLVAGTGGTHTGSGHAVNIAATAAAEAVARIASVLAANAVVAVDSNRIRIRSVGLGSDSNVKIDGGTANTAFGFDLATHVGYAAGPAATLRIDGKYDGAYANGFQIDVSTATNGEADEFNLTVKDSLGIILEVFPNLSMDDDSDRYVESIIGDDDAGSIWAAAVDLDAALSSQRPANGTVTLSGGNDGLVALADADFIGSEVGQTGLRAFDIVQGGTLMISPDRAVVAVHNAIITYCEITRNFEIFAVLDPPSNYSDTSIVTHKLSLTSSEMYDLYWPRVKIPNPSTAVFGDVDVLTVPPSGSLVGMYARSDARQLAGPFAQPVGVDTGRLYGVSDVENDNVLRESIRDKIFPHRINPIIFTPGVGIYPDGVRTGKGDGNFPSVGERRGASFVEMTLKYGLLFAKNQANTPELRAAVRRTIEVFLIGLMVDGAFASRKPDEAFFIDVSDELNPPSVQRAGKLIIRIGLATAAPAEFIIIRVTRDTRALDEEARARVG